MDLEKFGARTICVDCDVLQADGGTRTAAITGTYVALFAGGQATPRGEENHRKSHPSPIAAVSVGIVGGSALLDLCYTEDVAASVDMNLVMNGSWRIH